MPVCICNSRLDQDCTHNCYNLAATSQLFLSDLSDRDQIWDEHRAKAEQVEQLYRNADLGDHATRMHDCSRWLGFALRSEGVDELKLKLTEARFCRSRHCPVCQWRRSMKWRARFLAAVPRVAAAYPTHRWLFLTLTVENCPVGELRSTLKQMSAAWARLVKRRTWMGVGWIRSTEVTRSKNGYAHPHYHCLILVRSSYFSREYITHSEWCQLWRDCLRASYNPIVDVRTVKAKGETTETALQKAILETMKYGVKVQDLTADSEWLAELTYQVKGTRAITIGGVLRDFIREEDPEDLIHDEDESEEIKELEAELWFSWETLRKRYIKSER